jgi:hypothetical protein
MSTKKHLIKVIGLAVMAALAISAFASATASAHQWTIEGETLSKIKGEGTANGTGVTASAMTPFTLTGTVLGKKFVLTSTTLVADEAIIFQEGNVAKDEETLTFSGLTVDEPAGCSVESPITTKRVTSTVITHTGNNHVFTTFKPEEGEVFATIKVSGCAIAGSYNVKGEVGAEGDEWGVETVDQPLKFSNAIQTTLGLSLLLGTSAAELTGEATVTLTGGFAGKKFGVEKLP